MVDMLLGVDETDIQEGRASMVTDVSWDGAVRGGVIVTVTHPHHGAHVHLAPGPLASLFTHAWAHRRGQAVWCPKPDNDRLCYGTTRQVDPASIRAAARDLIARRLPKTNKAIGP